MNHQNCKKQKSFKHTYLLNTCVVVCVYKLVAVNSSVSLRERNPSMREIGSERHKYKKTVSSGAKRYV